MLLCECGACRHARSHNAPSPALSQPTPHSDYLFKVRRAPSAPCMLAKTLALDLTRAPSPPLSQLLLIGDSGVGKSCLLLRFAVSAKRGCAVCVSLSLALLLTHEHTRSRRTG